jgi:hypothetical protein
MSNCPRRPKRLATASRQDGTMNQATGSDRRRRRTPAAAPVEFRLDTASGVQTYLQLVRRVEHALRLGYLKPGDQLPEVETEGVA